MKYEYKVIAIDDLKVGDIVDIPRGSLILGKYTAPVEGYIHDPNRSNYVTTISILVPIKEGLVEI